MLQTGAFPAVDQSRPKTRTPAARQGLLAPWQTRCAQGYIAVRALAKWRLFRVLTYIDANIGSPITLASLAATAGLSRMYFARQFRAATGLRPHDYVVRKRIERAQQMLVATSNAVFDIALSVGFQTQAHFTTVFKRIVGSTPSQWRREQPNAAWQAPAAMGGIFAGS